jgi:flagellar FliL protein
MSEIAIQASENRVSLVIISPNIPKEHKRMAELEKEGTQENSGEKKSSNLVLIIIIVALVLVLLIVGAVFALLSGGDDDRGYEEQSSSSKKERPAKSMDSMKVGPMFPLDSFTVNLLSDSGRRYLKVQINLELDGNNVASELDSKTAVVRDIVIRLLSSKTLEEISTAKGKDTLKEQIISQLNLRLRDGNIRNVYFTEFVVQ